MNSREINRESGWSPLDEKLNESREIRRFGAYIVLLIALIGLAGGIASR